MENVVTQLTTTVTADSLWGVFGDIVPFLGVIIPVALGFWLVKRLLKGTTKAKLKV